MIKLPSPLADELPEAVATQVAAELDALRDLNTALRRMPPDHLTVRLKLSGLRGAQDALYLGCAARAARLPVAANERPECPALDGPDD